MLAVWLGADAPAAADAGAVPRFSTPEEAVRALAHAVRHARRRAAPPDPPFEPTDADTATAATIVAEGLGRGGGWLAPGDVERLLHCWGIPVVASRLAPSAQAAGRAAAELGGACRAQGGGAGLSSTRATREPCGSGWPGRRPCSRAAGAMARQLAAAGTTLEGFHVQRMAPEGPELIVGAVGDPAFGPLVACGAGGRRGRASRRHPGQARAARPARSRRHAPRPEDVPAARRLPRPPASRPRLRARPRHARRRARGRASRRRRARPQPGHRHARRARSSSTLASGSTPRAPPRRSPRSTPDPDRVASARGSPDAVRRGASTWMPSAPIVDASPW